MTNEEVEAVAEAVYTALPLSDGPDDVSWGALLERDDGAQVRRLSAIAARAAISKLDQMRGDGWLPIESAPKDGTRIVAYPVTMNEAGVVSWEPASRTPPVMRIVSGENHDQDGFWRVLLSMKPSPYPPTHYRPLPSPPTRSDQ